MNDTKDDSYAARLTRLEGARWKQVLNVQAPYRWNLRRQSLGRTLDIGCGIGRNLATLAAGSVGVDHNEAAIREARSRGLAALTLEEWAASDLRREGAFDSLLLAHVVEHLTRDTARDILEEYLPYLRPAGRVMFICPQERGYATDETHIEFTDGEALCELAASVGLLPQRSASFPLPRGAGTWFTYNEFIVIATKPVT